MNLSKNMQHLFIDKIDLEINLFIDKKEGQK